MEWRLFGDNLLGHATRIPRTQGDFFHGNKGQLPLLRVRGHHQEGWRKKEMQGLREDLWGLRRDGHVVRQAQLRQACAHGRYDAERPQAQGNLRRRRHIGQDRLHMEGEGPHRGLRDPEKRDAIRDRHD